MGMTDIREVLGVSKSSCHRRRQVFNSRTAKRPPSPLVGPVPSSRAGDLDCGLLENVFLPSRHRI